MNEQKKYEVIKSLAAGAVGKEDKYDRIDMLREIVPRR